MPQIQEPVSAYAAQYPHNNVTQTESGHFQEFDDTPGAERIRTQHRAGTFVEWQPDGTEVHRIEGNGYQIVAKDNNVIIKGACNIYIEGNAELTVKGDALTNIQGNQRTVVEKNYDLVVKGEYSVTSGSDINMTAGSLGSSFNIQTGDRLVLNTDLTVHGQILADDMYSEGAVTAGTGIHAGVPGSVNPIAGITTLGGISSGLPTPAAPGVIQATVMVTAPSVIGSTLVYGGILMDPEGGAPVIRQFFNSHFHIAPLGPTSPPTIPIP